MTYKPTIGAYIEVQSRKVQIYSSRLHIHARFTGLRYLLYHWPVTMAIIGVATNMFFLAVVVLMSWYNFTKTSDGSAEESGEWPLPLDGAPFSGALDEKDLLQDPYSSYSEEASGGKPETLAPSMPQTDTERKESDSQSSTEGWLDVGVGKLTPEEETLKDAESRMAQSLGQDVRQRHVQQTS